VSELDPYFVVDGARFVASVSTRGPWSADHQHGGPPAALCVRALEALAPKESLLTRLTFDLLRPVPIAPLTIAAEVVRAGAKVQRLRATLLDDAGRELIQATAVALRTAPTLPASLVEAATPPAPPDTSAPFEFHFFPKMIGYQHSVEARVAHGTWGSGSMAAWMRPRVPLVAGEAPSPLQRLLIVADSASGVAVALDPKRHSWVNADLTVAVHRAPEGEWICLDAATTTEAHGVALTRARLWDTRGPIGVSLQSLVIETR
jgi:hypothetical protein